MKWIFLIGLTLGVHLANGQSPNRLSVELNRIREIRLGANPSTGYHWDYALTDSTVASVSSRYEASQPVKPGSGGESVFTVKGLRKGTTLWVLTYVPPGRNAKGTRTITYLIHVR